MSDLQTFLSTHEYSEDFSILFEDKYVKQLKTYMNIHKDITLVWGGPCTYQVAYTGFCNLEDHLYKSHIIHNCFTKYLHKNMSNISCKLKSFSSSLVDLENHLNNQKLLNNWGDYELGKYEVTMERINAQKPKTVTYKNLTIHLLSISHCIHYLDQILEHKYKHQILKGHLHHKVLESEVLDFYNIKFNNKPSFSIAYTASAEIPATPTPAPATPTPPDDSRSIPRLVIYVDSRGISWSTPPLVNAGPTEYTDIICSFFLPSSGSATDFASIVLNPNPAYGGKAWIATMHQAGKRVMVSSGGATDLPTSASYFTTHEPLALAKNIADQIKAVGIDGIDIDWEDDWSNTNPGLTGYGAPTARGIGIGPAVQWLITLTTQLRNNLPYPRYTITHAPQAPYINIGYNKVWKGIYTNNYLDWFNMQFYNQGSHYIDDKSLVDCNIIPPPAPGGATPVSACPTWNGSITDINCAAGCTSPTCPDTCPNTDQSTKIPAYKIIVGKPVKLGDGNSGIVSPDDLVKLLKAGVAKFPYLGGAMGWQWASDMDGSWAKTLKTAFPPSRLPPPTPPPGPTPPPAPSPAPTPPPPTPPNPNQGLCCPSPKSQNICSQATTHAQCWPDCTWITSVTKCPT